MTNMYYSEAPWLVPNSMAAATGLMWHEVALTGTTAHEFEQQITDLQPFLSEHWRARISPRSGNPIYDRPVVLVVYRDDHKFLLDQVRPAAILVREGIEPVFQLTCRDRNRIALQSDLLGAAALGIRNLILTGDDPSAGDQPEAKPVFDLDSRKLIETAVGIRDRHELPSGRRVAGGADFFIGVADTPLDPAPSWTSVSLRNKIASGAQFAQTQFCMDGAITRRYMNRLAKKGITERLFVLIGIGPLPSARTALWMREHLPGSIIPDAVIDRLARAGDPKAEGKRICIELLQELTQIPAVSGAHIMAPLGHDKIQADDIRRGLDAFSTDLIYDIDLEIRDVLPFAEDVLYTFFGQSALLSEQDVNVLLSQRFNIAQRQKLVNILLWYGVIGVIRQRWQRSIYLLDQLRHEDVATAGKTDLESTIAVFLSVVIIGESGDGDVVKSVMNATKASSSVSWAAVRRLLIAMPA